MLRVDLLEVPQRLHHCWGTLHIGIIYHDVTYTETEEESRTTHSVTNQRHISQHVLHPLSYTATRVLGSLTFSIMKTLTLQYFPDVVEGNENVRSLFVSLFPVFISAGWETLRVPTVNWALSHSWRWNQAATCRMQKLRNGHLRNTN